jgi:hypothetical protein
MLDFVKQDSFKETEDMRKWSTRTEVSVFKNVPWRLQSGGGTYKVVANEIVT